MDRIELPLFTAPEGPRQNTQILADIRSLVRMHKNGLLGGAIMPEDAHPALERNSEQICHYFTLGMALNYQRNSYSLWRAATATFCDPGTSSVFEPKKVSSMNLTELSSLLMRHRLGLQPIKHTQTWHTLCCSITELYAGDIRKLFDECEGDAGRILLAIQQLHKKKFPYLSGPKIANYWLYVMSSYTDLKITNREALNVAPDTHVIQASRKLGLITSEEETSQKLAIIVADRWKSLLADTEYAPIDVHTPLWLWSKSGFKPIIEF